LADDGKDLNLQRAQQAEGKKSGEEVWKVYSSIERTNQNSKRKEE